MVAFREYQDLSSVAGIRKVYVAGLIGQIERFEDQTKLAKCASLCWKVKQSGNYQSQSTPLRRINFHLLNLAIF